MRYPAAVPALAGSLALCLALPLAASAQHYEVLLGSLTDASSGRTVPLGGSFDALPGWWGFPNDVQIFLRVDDFDLVAGDRSFTPRGPVEYDGLTPAPFISLADQIQVLGDQVGLVRLHAGGLHAVGEDEVVFRTFEFRSDVARSGEAIGVAGDGPAPRRLHLEGTLFQVDQAFGFPDEDCSPPFNLPPRDGGVVIDGGTIIQYDGFDIDPSEVVEFVSPGPSPPLHRVTGDGSTIGGTIEGNGTIVLLNPNLVSLSPVSVSLTGTEPFRLTEAVDLEYAGTDPRAVPPSLEQLGITAPDGAVVTLDDGGALTVTTEGDLFVADGGLDLPGLTSVTLVAGGTIEIAGSLALPDDATLDLRASGPGTIGEGPPGGVIVQPIPGPSIFCDRLIPRPREEQEIGPFSLVATAATPVEIDVQPWGHRNRVKPGSRRILPVGILGSADFDVTDIRRGTLRLGRGEARPIGRHRGFRLNRDRHRDLLALFRTRDAEVAFGDTHLCLTAETWDGTLVEGCDTIRTLPRRRRPTR